MGKYKDLFDSSDLEALNNQWATSFIMREFI